MELRSLAWKCYNKQAKIVNNLRKLNDVKEAENYEIPIYVQNLQIDYKEATGIIDDIENAVSGRML